jgi:hypothetical protein
LAEHQVGGGHVLKCGRDLIGLIRGALENQCVSKVADGFGVVFEKDLAQAGQVEKLCLKAGGGKPRANARRVSAKSRPAWYWPAPNNFRTSAKTAAAVSSVAPTSVAERITASSSPDVLAEVKAR